MGEEGWGSWGGKKAFGGWGSWGGKESTSPFVVFRQNFRNV
jgi:hypothetical protein